MYVKGLQSCIPHVLLSEYEVLSETSCPGTPKYEILFSNFISFIEKIIL